MLNDEDVLRAKLRPNVRAKLFANRALSEGAVVAVRLNLNGWVRKEGQKFALQSIHAGLSWRNRVIGYDIAATVSGAVFMVGEAERDRIAAGTHKFPMAAVVGAIKHGPLDLSGVEIRFNPRETRWFVRVDDGRPVKAADEVTIFHTRAYARGRITYLEEAAA